MARILLALFFIAVTVFAVADWVVRSKTYTPGRINRWVWLAVILLLPLVGPLTWIIVGMVTRAEEERQLGKADLTDFGSYRPDDNPDAISDIVDRINRRRRRTKFGPGGLDLSKKSEDDQPGDTPGSKKPNRGDDGPEKGQPEDPKALGEEPPNKRSNGQRGGADEPDETNGSDDSRNNV